MAHMRTRLHLFGLKSTKYAHMRTRPLDIVCACVYNHTMSRETTEARTVRVEKGFGWVAFRRQLEDAGWLSLGQWLVWAAKAWVAAPFGPERVGLASKKVKDAG